MVSLVRFQKIGPGTVFSLDDQRDPALGYQFHEMETI